MKSFIFHNTTKIIFGKNQISEITNNIPKDSKVLVTYGGGSIKNNGVYDQVKTALKDFDWDEFSGIEPNPQYDTLVKAVKKVKEEGFNYLLAVGGGSVIDGTKFISAASLFEGENVWDICEKFAPVTKAVSIGCVLTIPATGSESNCGSVVSKGDDKLFFSSPLVRPQFAVLDPATTISLPERQTANGVIDAFVHTMEQYCTYQTNSKVQDRYAEALLMTLIEEGPKALKNPNDLETRANIMWAASQALNELIAVGVPQDWATHMIGHEITGLYGVDHARTLSIVYPAVMSVCRKEKEGKILQYAQRVFNITSGSSDDIIDMAITKTKEFFKAMGVPVSLSEVNLGEKDIEAILKNLSSHNRLPLGEHGKIDLETAREILKTAL